jgi:hypothetical protein
MIQLKNAQLKTVMAAADCVPFEKRGQFFQRINAMLTIRGRGHFDDDHVAEAVERALVGLTHSGSRPDPIGTPLVR